MLNTSVPRKEKGNSVLEVLFSIALSGIILASIIAPLRLSVEISRSSRLALELEQKKERLYQTLDGAFEHSSSPIWPDNIKLHPKGEIRLHSGRLHSVHHSSTLRRPLSNQSAISFLQSDLTTQLLIQEGARPLVLKNGGLQENFCLVYPPSRKSILSKLSKTTVWLALGVDGASLVEASVRRIRSKNTGCESGTSYIGTVRSIEDSVIKPRASPLSTRDSLRSTFALVPVTEYFTLYLDRNNQLRFLSHLSRENQPLLEGLTSFDVSLSTSSKRYHLYKIRYQLQGSKEEPQALYFTQPVLTGNNWNYDAIL